ncbi:MAG TPA: CHAT domain-containing protein [Longimicrobium sp.]|nr:CHAT domain-containing protein [Longimicrobium sp.]
MQGFARFRRDLAHARLAVAAAGVALVVVAALLLGGRRSAAAHRAELPVSPRFAREAGRDRLIGPRLSISRHHAPCPARIPPGGTIPRTTCPAARRTPSAALRATVARAGADPLDPAAYAAALSDVLWADDGGISLDRSISFLHTAARLAEDPAVPLADLSGAYLARAEVRQGAEDLFRALDAAARALELDPQNAAACFNRATALEYMGADWSAAKAWERCAMIDGRSGWGGEARRRAAARAAAAADTILRRPPSPGAPPAEVDAFVAADPGAARVHGWGEVLGAWGGAVLRGDSAAARGQLALADAIARALARRGGDRTLEDAVAAIHATARAPDARMRLARGHQAYARGMRAYEEVDHTAAAPYVARVLSLRPPSATLLAWTRRLESLVVLAEGDLEGAAMRLAADADDADTLRHPALAAALHQNRGAALLRNRRFEGARDASDAARRLFARIGETENAGASRYQQADAELYLLVPEAYTTMHHALTELRTFRRSRWLHTSLTVLAMELAGEGLPHAALAAYDEALTVARATGRDYFVAEALLWRAQLLASMGRLREAEADLAAAEPIVLRLPDGERRTWFVADLHAARSVLLLRNDPRRAAAQMDSLLAVPGGARTGPRILLGLLGRAQARMATGDAEGAATDLDSATWMLAEQRDLVAYPPLRASILDEARGTFDQLVMLRLARGDTLGALQALERGRVSLGQARGPAGGSERWALPPGTAALDLALIGDTLLAWAATPRTLVLHRRTIDGAGLLRTVERLRTELELRAPSAEVQSLLAALYDELVRPLRPALPEGVRLAVVTDGELGDVPFAALYDARERRYLLESYTPVTVSSLRDVRARPADPPWAGKPALFVSDPAFDRAAYPGLSRLPGAAAEVASIAPLYPDTMLLPGEDAKIPAVISRLPRARVFHFAGHAVFDDERPGRSFLLLASVPGDSAGGRLGAPALGALDLRAVDLVVLSSCETLRSPGGRSGGFAGLAGALLGAGVDGVVGSAWRVEDGLTRQLMTELHRGYRRTGDAAASLRASQLLALHGRDPALREPSVWAAFRYVGN